MREYNGTDGVRRKRQDTNQRYGWKRANVKILLCNYRAMTAHCENAVVNIRSIRASVARTREILEHVNAMLEQYRIYCDRSPRDEDRRRYRVIYGLYLADTPQTPEEIAAAEYVGLRTVYRDIDASVEALTGLIFGIDGIQMK